jgi:hypothetical protein
VDREGTSKQQSHWYIKHTLLTRESFLFIPSRNHDQHHGKHSFTMTNSSEASPDLSDIEKSPATDPQTKAVSSGSPPDGGVAAWLVVLGGFCTVFASFGWINCIISQPLNPPSLLKLLLGIGIFQTHYQTHQLASYAPSTVAWIPSTESFMMFFWVRRFPPPLSHVC